MQGVPSKPGPRTVSTAKSKSRESKPKLNDPNIVFGYSQPNTRNTTINKHYNPPVVESTCLSAFSIKPNSKDAKHIAMQKELREKYGKC